MAYTDGLCDFVLKPGVAAVCHMHGDAVPMRKGTEVHCWRGKPIGPMEHASVPFRHASGGPLTLL